MVELLHLLFLLVLWELDFGQHDDWHWIELVASYSRHLSLPIHFLSGYAFQFPLCERVSYWIPHRSPLSLWHVGVLLLCGSESCAGNYLV